MYFDNYNSINQALMLNTDNKVDNNTEPAALASAAVVHGSE